MTTSACRYFAGDDGPATRAARRVRDLLDGGALPTDVAVLARVNASLAPVQVLLRNDGVPVNGGVSGQFLQRGGVRAALAWLTVATAPDRALPGRIVARRRAAPQAWHEQLASRPCRQAAFPGRPGQPGGLARCQGQRSGGGQGARPCRGPEAGPQGGRKAGRPPRSWLCCDPRSARAGWTRARPALDQWSHGAIAAHGDDLDALGELADLESDASRFPAWLSEQLNAPDDARRGHPGIDPCREGPGVATRRGASRHLGAHAAPAGRGHRGGAAGVPRRSDSLPVERLDHPWVAARRRSFSSWHGPANRWPLPGRPMSRRGGPARPALGRHRFPVRQQLRPRCWWRQSDRALPTAATITRSSP